MSATHGNWTGLGRRASVPRLAVVSNIPAPYREPVFELLAKRSEFEIHLFYCSDREPDREWRLEEANYPRTILRKSHFSLDGRFIHVNFDVVPALRRFAPDVVLTTGFNPTHLFAFAYALANRKVHLAMTDGTDQSERKLTRVHRTIRRLIYRRTEAFIGASEGSIRLYRSYGVPEQRIFRSPLSVDNARFMREKSGDATTDLLFCGRMVDIKNPLFALDVAHQCAMQLGRRVSICFAGSGPLEPLVRAKAAQVRASVDAKFSGFIQQSGLPGIYQAAKVFLFPTRWDPWGVVANEAAAAGLPTIISPMSGAAGELVVHGESGYILELDLAVWAQAAARLLGDEALRSRMGLAATRRVQQFTYESAAEGIVEAMQEAIALAR